MDEGGTAAGHPIATREVVVPIEAGSLPGTLSIPAEAAGIVAFAHGSGSSRYSPRNRHVAAALNRRRLGTLLVDLLSAEEEAVDRVSRALRFDIELLAKRLVAVERFVGTEVSNVLPFGLFGASTGAGAALVAAARPEARVAAVVSRGGRPDLAGAALSRVRAPTLLIVGSRDTEVLALNRQALRHLNERSRLLVVPGASHLFEESGTLDVAANAAAAWFLDAFAPGLHQVPRPAV